MAEHEGKLTTAQFEILRLLWDAEQGMTVAEIWAAICNDRPVSRTTVLNLVDRLEKRNWLSRKKTNGVYRYFARAERQKTEAQLASEFVSDYFDGSPASFVLSLLGSKGVSKSEVKRLRALIHQLPTNATKGNSKRKNS